MAHPASSKVAGLALSAIAWIVQKRGRCHVAWQHCTYTLHGNCASLTLSVHLTSLLS